jgi:hypothetical protein
VPDVHALSKLQHVGQLGIRSCAALENVDGLEHLASASDVSITSNMALTNVRGLRGLTSMPNLTVSDNPMLPQCEIDWLAAHVPLNLSQNSNGPDGTCGP